VYLILVDFHLHFDSLGRFPLRVFQSIAPLPLSFDSTTWLESLSKWNSILHIDGFHNYIPFDITLTWSFPKLSPPTPKLTSYRIQSLLSSSPGNHEAVPSIGISEFGTTYSRDSNGKRLFPMLRTLVSESMWCVFCSPIEAIITDILHMHLPRSLYLQLLGL
jgi:hypothetical protein